MKTQPISYQRHRFPSAIISHAVWLYHRFCLSFREVEELLAERGILVTYESIRRWCLKFGPAYVRRLKKRQGQLDDAALGLFANAQQQFVLPLDIPAILALLKADESEANEALQIHNEYWSKIDFSARDSQVKNIGLEKISSKPFQAISLLSRGNANVKCYRIRYSVTWMPFTSSSSS